LLIHSNRDLRFLIGGSFGGSFGGSVGSSLLLLWWFLLIPATCSFQVVSLPSAYLVSVQLHIGTMVYFADLDPAHELGLGPKLDLGPDIYIDQDFSSSGALVHLAEYVLPTDTATLLQFFKYHGIEDNNDFMSFDETDFKKKYSDLSNAPYTLLALSTVLIEKLLALKTWYVAQMQDYDSDPFPIYYSLTHDILNTWRRTQTVQQFDTRSTSSFCSFLPS
jgi:hypothetical protein